jgi:hypothetical protein
MDSREDLQDIMSKSGQLFEWFTALQVAGFSEITGMECQGVPTLAGTRHPDCYPATGTKGGSGKENEGVARLFHRAGADAPEPEQGELRAGGSLLVGGLYPWYMYPAYRGDPGIPQPPPRYSVRPSTPMDRCLCAGIPCPSTLYSTRVPAHSTNDAYY